MRSNPNIAQRKRFKSEVLASSQSRDTSTVSSLPKMPKLSIKTFLNSLEAGSKYGLRLNMANLKIIENSKTLVLEMRDLDVDEIEELLMLSLGKLHLFILY